MYDYEQLNKDRLGRRIVLARTKKGLTQVALAFAMFFKQSEIGKYETGKRIPKDATLKLISDKLEEDYKWLKYGDKSTFESKETEFGKEIKLNHFTSVQTKKQSTEIINNLLSKLSTDNLAVLSELAEALYLDENPKLLQAALDKEVNDFNQEIAKAKEEFAKTQPVYAGISFMADVALLKDVYPDLYEELINKWNKNHSKYKDKDKEVERNLKDWQEINRSAQIRAWDENPDLEEKFFKEFIDKEKMTNKDRVHNRRLLKNIIIPELMKREQEKNKYRRKELKASQK